MLPVLWLAAAAGVVAAWSFLRRVASAGAGYKAKVAASALFVSKLPIDPNAAPEVCAEAYTILRLFPARVDAAAGRVTASLLGLGWRKRTAVLRGPEAGCCLAEGEPLAVAIPAAKPAAALPAGKAPSATLSRVIDEAFTEKDGGLPRRTRAVVVLREGRVLAEAYGPGITAQTPLPGWSMTKSVLGCLAGAATGQGALETGRRSLLEEWSRPGDGRAAIALEDLLRMRSGLSFAEVYANPVSDVVQMLFARDDAAGYAAARPLAHAPGTHWQYSSGTTNILSLVLRRALGDAAYHAFPRRALFDPIGMESAVFEPDASGTFVGSSFMFATARDWARLGLLCLRDGEWDGKRVLPAGWLKFAATPTPQAPPGLYGAHWWLKLVAPLGGGTPDEAKVPSDAYHALGHEGQCVTVIPSRGLVVVRLGLSINVNAWNHAAFLARLLEAV